MLHGILKYMRVEKYEKHRTYKTEMATFEIGHHRKLDSLNGTILK